MKDWEKEPCTEKQLQYIRDIQEFSAYNPPVFCGTSKGEAADYIDKYGKLAHEDTSSPTFGY